MVQFKEGFIVEVFFAGLRRGQNHLDAAFEFVLRKLFIDVLKIKRIADKLFIDLTKELVSFKRAEPLDPSNLSVWVCGLVGKGIDLISLIITLTVVVLLWHNAHVLLIHLIHQLHSC